MKEQWDERYAAQEYIYGTKPNEWFASKLGQLIAGSLLLPAEGEGRNAVFAARGKWRVSAFDQSAEARKKALTLATENGVTIDYQLGDLLSFTPTAVSYDALALIFVHMPEEIRATVHSRLMAMLKPGGHLIFEAFSKEQLNYRTGGPKTESLLYEKADIATDFAPLRLIEFTQTITHLNEGPLHNGDASVIRLFAQKPL